jgi:hypothetical protein
MANLHIPIRQRPFRRGTVANFARSRDATIKPVKRSFWCGLESNHSRAVAQGVGVCTDGDGSASA